MSRSCGWREPMSVFSSVRSSDNGVATHDATGADQCSDDLRPHASECRAAATLGQADR
jgi:hypothetical protein